MMKLFKSYSENTNKICTEIQYDELEKAVKECDLNKIKILVKQGYDLNNNKDLLFTAVNNNSIDIVKYLISQNIEIFRLNRLDKHGRSVLTITCSYNNYKITKLLIKLGANVNPPKVTIDHPGFNIETPLTKAVSHNNYKLVKLLLENGATQLDDDYHIYNDAKEMGRKMKVDKKIIEIMRIYVIKEYMKIYPFITYPSN